METKDIYKISPLLIEYYNYLLKQDVKSKKSIDYLYYLRDLLELTKRVKKIEFNNNINCAGLYNSIDKTISLNFEILNVAHKLGFIDDNAYNIEVLTPILHELIHAYQEDHSDTNLYDFCENLRIKSLHCYREYHDFYPLEIDATIESNYIVNSLIHQILSSNEYSDEKLFKNFFKGRIVNNQLINSPLLYLLNQIKQPIDLDRFNLSNKERILYGFEIPQDIQEKIKKIYKERNCSSIRTLIK